MLIYECFSIHVVLYIIIQNLRKEGGKKEKKEKS